MTTEFAISAIILIVISHCAIVTTGAPATGLNGTVCILAPPEMAARIQAEVQRQVMEQLQQRDEQQLLTPGIPPAFRSNDPRYNVPLRPPPPPPLFAPSRGFFDQPLNSTSSPGRSTTDFWNQPPNSNNASGKATTGKSSRNNSSNRPNINAFGYQADDPAMQQRRIPASDVYDRSGFRREPLHPSFQSTGSSDQRVPSLVSGEGGDASQRTGSDPNRVSTTPSSQPWNRFTTPAPRREPAPQTSFFDPTRRPKTSAGGSGRDQWTTTTRRPFYNKDGGSKSTGGRRPQTPGLTSELTTRGPGKTSAGDTLSGGSAIDPTDASQSPDVVPGPVDPTTGSSPAPEYAYIKQPISSVLEQPDLELEGKPIKFGILKDALSRVGLLDLMSQSENPVTVFAPTDEAFLNLDSETLSVMQQDPSFLRNTMLRHIVNFDMPPDSLRNNIIVPSYSGEPLIMSVIEGTGQQKTLMMVAGTPIVAATNTLNGVIYVINKVMTQETTTSSVAEELASRPETQVFYQFISRSTQIRRLQGQGPYTILAPSNQAFDKLSPATRTALDLNPILLERLLSYHIVEGAIFRKELESSSSLPSSPSSRPTTGTSSSSTRRDPMSRRVEPIKLRTASDGSVTLNDVALIQTADIQTGNGVIHVIDSVLMPAELANTLRKIENRSLAKAAAAAASGGAFPTATTTSSAALQRDQPPSVRPTFGFSSSSAHPQSDRSANFVARNGARRQNAVNNNSNRRTVTASSPSQIEREGAPKTQDDESASRFFAWLKRSGFLDVLTNTGNNYTVILPIDRAVNRLPLAYQQSLETKARQLESLLMYHIIPGYVNLTKLKDEDTIPTVSGKDIRFNRLSNDTMGNNTKLGSNTTEPLTTTTTSTLTTTRAPTRDPNGRLKNSTSTQNADPLPHVTFSGAVLVGRDSSTIPSGKIVLMLVDRVMYPPQGNLFDVISASPILKSLASLIKVAGLESGLADTGPFTLFAPSDSAFQKLPLDSISYLSHDPQSSRAFLLRHIIRPVLFTSAVPIGNQTVIESTTGEKLQLIRDKDVVKVDGVGIRYADITATNGVIHVIDHVL